MYRCSAWKQKHKFGNHLKQSPVGFFTCKQGKFHRKHLSTHRRLFRGRTPNQGIDHHLPVLLISVEGRRRHGYRWNMFRAKIYIYIMHRQWDRDKERQTERQRETEIERERERGTERERERERARNSLIENTDMHNAFFEGAAPFVSCFPYSSPNALCVQTFHFNPKHAIPNMHTNNSRDHICDIISNTKDK